MEAISEQLREAMRQWTTGVCIVCSRFGNMVHGMTVNSFTSVSLDPPIVAITLANQTRTANLVQKSGRFSVSILAKNQKSLAEKFSGKVIEGPGRFDNVSTVLLPNEIPGIAESLSLLACEVIQVIPFKNSSIYLGKVLYSEVIHQSLEPLVYQNREYKTL